MEDFKSKIDVLVEKTESVYSDTLGNDASLENRFNERDAAIVIARSVVAQLLESGVSTKKDLQTVYESLQQLPV